MSKFTSRISLLFYFGVFSSAVFAYSEIYSVNVHSSINEEVQHTVLPYPDSGLLTKEVWRSPAGIMCLISAVPTAIGSYGTFECKSQEGYKAQISFDCSVNASRDSSAYLFFGLVGKAGNNRNFYVWCE